MQSSNIFLSHHSKKIKKIKLKKNTLSFCYSTIQQTHDKHTTNKVAEQANEISILGKEVEDEVDQEASPLHGLPKHSYDLPYDDRHHYYPPVIRRLPAQNGVVGALQELRRTAPVVPHRVPEQVHDSSSLRPYDQVPRPVDDDVALLWFSGHCLRRFYWLIQKLDLLKVTAESGLFIDKSSILEERTVKLFE